MRRTKEDAEITKSNIIKASIIVMNRKGIALTRFEDIAEEAKVTRGAIYHYFKSKNEILFAIHESSKRKLIDLFEKHLSENVDPIQSLKGGLTEIFEKFENDIEYRSRELLFLKAEFNNLLKNDKELSEIFTKERWQTIQKLRDLMIRGQNMGSIRIDLTPDNLVFFIISVYVGFITSTYLELNEFISNGKIDNYINILIEGIKA